MLSTFDDRTSSIFYVGIASELPIGTLLRGPALFVDVPDEEELEVVVISSSYVLVFFSSP